jgi:WhiB family redox-sensing transcriptional regulator
MDDVEWLMYPMPPEVMDLFHRPAWHDEAACRALGPGTFFPGSDESLNIAFAVCARCPVKVECLDYALGDPSLKGVWGGTSGRERVRLRAGRSNDVRHSHRPVDDLLTEDLDLAQRSMTR